MELIEKKLSEITPYENNPRLNTAAVEEVKQSIEQCGYITPIVIDEDGVILAGHTRYQALIEMDCESVECIVVKGLEEDQRRKFRLLDNKVAEIATWDIDKLREELEGLEFGSYEGFAFLTKEQEKYEDIDISFTQKIICPKCGAEVEDEA